MTNKPRRHGHLARDRESTLGHLSPAIRAVPVQLDSLPSAERLWTLEDCRQLTRLLERELIAAGERLVRVPPKLMASERRAGRERSKSDPIDALVGARAALRGRAWISALLVRSSCAS